MKALTLWQPWASLWAAGIKRNETRSWATSHRGPLVVHAAKLSAQSLYNCIGVCAYHDLNDRCIIHLGRDIQALDRGCIVGTVDVVECLSITNTLDGRPVVEYPLLANGIIVTDEEAALGNYSPGRYAWIGAQHWAFEPIPCRGGQRLWAVSSIEAAVLAGEGLVKP